MLHLQPSEQPDEKKNWELASYLTIAYRIALKFIFARLVGKDKCKT